MLTDAQAGGAQRRDPARAGVRPGETPVAATVHEERHAPISRPVRTTLIVAVRGQPLGLRSVASALRGGSCATATLTSATANARTAVVAVRRHTARCSQTRQSTSTGTPPPLVNRISARPDAVVCSIGPAVRPPDESLITAMRGRRASAGWRISVLRHGARLPVRHDARRDLGSTSGGLAATSARCVSRVAGKAHGPRRPRHAGGLGLDA